MKFNHELIGIEGENSLVERAVAINNQTQETSKIDVHGIFIAIGHKPNTDIFKGQINLDENGYIKTVPGSTKTNLPGILQRVMFRTIFIDKQLPQQEAVVCRQWMQKNIWQNWSKSW